jgi:hypothetical protein
MPQRPHLHVSHMQSSSMSSFLANPFRPSARAGGAWFSAGLASSYPDVDDSTRVGEQRLCRDKYTPGCRIYHVPKEDSSKAVQLSIDDWKDPDNGDSKDQVMVFQYKGKFVAINHVRPAASKLKGNHEACHLLPAPHVDLP